MMISLTKRNSTNDQTITIVMFVPMIIIGTVLQIINAIKHIKGRNYE